MGRPTDPDRIVHIDVGPRQVVSNLKEAPIDRLALDFCLELERAKARYAIVGGYVAILLGRPRESDDVDIIADPLTEAEFARLNARLVKKFDCLTPGDSGRLYSSYLAAGSESTAVRYARKGSFVPNVEFKFTKNELDHAAVRRRLPVTLNGQKVHVGPLELQIGYKLYMGSPKDFEDARWMFKLAKEHLDLSEIERTAKALEVPSTTRRRVLGI